jgi:hypothetical protein
MPGTQAQNVRWVALDEQLPPARTGVPLGLALALALVLPLAEAVALLVDELDPLLHAASSVIALALASPAMTNRLVALRVILLPDLFDNIGGDSFVGLLS